MTWTALVVSPVKVLPQLRSPEDGAFPHVVCSVYVPSCVEYPSTTTV